ncbi:MAG: protein tyrosine phosphatase, partial [Isosphaeraceae bacterium]
PRVIRPTFSRVPPSAYRLAEPGDTLDRIELYLSALAVVMAGAGLAAGRPRGAWPAGFAISLAVLWYSATPGPTVDGWHGLGWRTMFDSEAPWTLRVELLAAALALGSVIAVSLVRHRRSSAAGLLSEARRTRGSLDLWIAAAVLAMARQFEIPGVEPVGYWPRWAMIAAIMALDLGLLIEL